MVTNHGRFFVLWVSVGMGNAQLQRKGKSDKSEYNYVRIVDFVSLRVSQYSDLLHILLVPSCPLRTAWNLSHQFYSPFYISIKHYDFEIIEQKLRGQGSRIRRYAVKATRQLGSGTYFLLPTFKIEDRCSFEIQRCIVQVPDTVYFIILQIGCPQFRCFVRSSFLRTVSETG
jgi:hypothetical protein